MLSFRQKIFISYVVVFLFFFILLFPYSSRSVRNAIRDVLEDRTNQVIQNIKKAPNIQGMIQILNAQQSLVFFRVTLLSKDGRILYESHTDRSALPLYKRHPEVEDALKYRIGYHEDYSYHFGEQFAYIAKAFPFQGQLYILRTAFPINQIKDLTKSFKLVLIKFGVGILVLFGLMTWTIMYLLTKPIQLIIEKVKPYQQGLVDELPLLTLEEKGLTTEFKQLADTLNLLRKRIQDQIETLTEERNQTESVLNSLDEGVIAVDNRLEVTFVNAIALQMFHLHKEEVLGRHVNVFQSEQCTQFLKNCMEKDKVIYDTLDLQRADQTIPLGIIATPKNDHAGALLVLQDKTNVYQILDMGKAFIANASHELKTPLTVIRGFAETLQQNPNMEEGLKEGVAAKIVENCTRMDALVKNLLRLADIENLPQSQLKPCDILHCLEDCASIVPSLSKEAQVQVVDHIQEKALVSADPDLLNRAFMNLIENAIKYNAQTPLIRLEIKRKNDLIEVTVSDNGIGIPPKDLPHIFERFYRVDKARARKQGGSGLGLSIVQIIVEKMGGTISVDSKQGEGTTFTLTFQELKL